MTSHDIRFGRPSDAVLEARLAVAVDARLTYGHVGSTLRPDSVSGRMPHRESVVLRDGPGAFDSAVDGLRAWACHRGIGAVVFPTSAPIEEGVTLLVILPVGPVSIIVPNRIVAVVDEVDRFGFAYGSLEGHQERGEESFVVERVGDGSVRATATVDAVPATRRARIVAPAVTWFSHLAARRYLGALREVVLG